MKNVNITIISFLFLAFIALVSSCEVDPCFSTICENDGICIDGTYDCPDGFSGVNCEIQDPCFGVVCEEYDGTCESGDCTCTEFTMDYLVGSWDVNSSYFYLFNDDGTYSITGANTESGTYEVNSANRLLTLQSTLFSVSQINFSCDSFDIDSFTFVRK